MTSRFVMSRGGNLEFARTRFERRGIPVQAISATEKVVYPDLRSGCDFVAALEILEHLPSSIQALERIHSALGPGGVFVIRERTFEAEPDADHLDSTHDEWVSGRYTGACNKLFTDLTPRYGRRFRGSKYMKVYEKIISCC